ASDGNFYFKYLDKIYYAKEPEGKDLTKAEIWALENNLDLSVPHVQQMYFLLRKNKSFHQYLQKYMDRLINLLSQIEPDEQEIKKAMREMFKEIRALHNKIADEILIE
ncbi:hypothetical protein, partial [Mycoplasma nasistruthionis]|uniref:hypothetical protein n=1 Tax=Mycoplasma nasistruthionis TaxID=353852 RepID=UPI001C9E5383